MRKHPKCMGSEVVSMQGNVVCPIMPRYAGKNYNSAVHEAVLKQYGSRASAVEVGALLTSLLILII